MQIPAWVFSEVRAFGPARPEQVFVVGEDGGTRVALWPIKAIPSLEIVSCSA